MRKVRKKAGVVDWNSKALHFHAFEAEGYCFHSISLWDGNRRIVVFWGARAHSISVRRD